MKLAVFGDIHGNSRALEAVLADMDSLKVDARICLGDLAFRGPDPQGAIERVFGAGLDGVVVGNTDQWLFRGFPEGFAPGEEKLKRLTTFREWVLERIDAKSLKALESLPMSTTVKLEGHTVTVVHASPSSTEAWFDASLPDQELLKIFKGAGPCDILVCGHIHTPYVRRINRRWVVNTGSVGNPIDGDYRASYALFTAENGGLSIQIRRVPYDVVETGEDAVKAGFPFATQYAEAIRCGAQF